MKVIHTLALVGLCTVAAGLVACNKPESTAPDATAPKAVTDVQKPVAPAAPAPAANAQADSLIAKAQSLITKKEYADALSTLKDAAALKLIPEQQKLVDNLMAQAKKALASDATTDASKKASDAVGGLMK